LLFLYYVCYCFTVNCLCYINFSFFLGCTSIFQQKSLLLIECNQEIEKIKRKYDSLLQNEESSHLQTQRELADIYSSKVHVKKSLAENFRGASTPSSTAPGIQLNIASISHCFQSSILVITSLSAFSFACCDIFV
jgi:hypothetical protein